MRPIISVLHPTMGRPEKAIQTMHEWRSMADVPQRIEWIFSTHDDDPTVLRFIPLLGEYLGHPTGLDYCFNNIERVSTALHGSAANCQNAATHAKGKLLINASDDFECEKAWDKKLIDRLISEARLDWWEKPIAVALSDGYRKDRLCTISCETRKYTDLKGGEFLHPGYPGIFSDDEWTYRAYRDAKEGKIQLIEAKDIVFRHAHPSNDPSVPMDDTYRFQNRGEAYRQGVKLFFERNPRAATDGIRTW